MENLTGSNKRAVAVILVKDVHLLLFMSNVCLLEGDMNPGLVTTIFFKVFYSKYENKRFYNGLFGHPMKAFN